MLEEKTTIQMAKISDALEIALLSKTEIEFGLGWGWTEKKVKRKIRDKVSNVAIAKKGETLIGFGIMKYGDKQANLDLLVVKPEYRRQNTGSQILRWLEEVAKIAGIFNIYIQARDRNLTARKLYTRLGYTLIERIPGHYQHQEDGVVFYKRISTNNNTV